MSAPGALATTCWGPLAISHAAGKSIWKRRTGCRNVLPRARPCSGLSPYSMPSIRRVKSSWLVENVAPGVLSFSTVG